MCCTTMWCYLIVLTLLDLSINTKLSAQGKGHGNGGSIHDSLMEGISLQEWGKDSEETGARGRALPAGVLAVSPPALHFGQAALAAPHALTVTITNLANETIHLASVAGTTPDFHASFFDSKTLEAGSNTSFTVVYLGRREGPVGAALFVHTSRGTLRYRVSAVGVASAWRVWPLVGVRVPANASVEARLALYNPGPAAVQVRSVAAAGPWLALALPGGGGAAPAAAWLVPPRAAVPLVTLRVRAPAAPAPAYVRIHGNMSDGPLIVAVEALPAPPGEYLQPLQLRLTLRGSADPPDKFSVAAASSASTPRRLRAAVAGAHCSSHLAPPLYPPPPYEDDDYASLNGAGDDSGVRVSLIREHLDPHQELIDTAEVTLDYGAMWTRALAAPPVTNGDGDGAGAAAGGAAEGAWCGGWVRVGRAALPYSVRLLRGTLRLRPDTLHFVTSEGSAGLEPQEVIAYNEFDRPVRIAHVEVSPEIEQYFRAEWSPVELSAGGSARAVRVRALAHAHRHQARGTLRLHTDVTEYSVSVVLYTARLAFHWEWPEWSGGELRLGALGSEPLRVAGRLHNGGPAPLCAALGVQLPGAQAELEFAPCEGEERCGCVAAGGARALRLTVRGGAWRGAGALWARTPHAETRVRVLGAVLPGALTAPDVLLPPAAPYVWSSAPLVLESDMPGRMRVVDVTQPDPSEPALVYRAGEEGEVEIGPGRNEIGRVEWAGERACGGACYTGLADEAAEWAARGPQRPAEDAAQARARRGRLAALREATGALHVRTDRVLRVPVAVRVRWTWPTLLAAPAPPPRRVPVGGDLPLVVHVHNPSHSPLLLQPLLDAEFHPTGEPGEAAGCEACLWTKDAFALGEWRVTRGAAAFAPWAPSYLLLQPHAHVDLTVNFTPHVPADLGVYLYLRNNLTVVERVAVIGRGAHPSFELAGRKPNSTAPITLEVSECGAGGGAGVARATLTLRNTGAVPLRLRQWTLAGRPCAARGLRLQPCAPLALAPNHTRTLTLTYATDWTHTRAHATLAVRAGARDARWHLVALTPARLLRRCEPHARRPPFEAPLRALGAALALLALAGAAALAAVDAERALRRARASRPPPERGGAPLDLRALARPDPPPPAPAVPRRRRTPRRRPAPLDPAEERRAFERWRSSVERRAAPPPDDSSPSDEEEEPPPPPSDTSSSSPECTPPHRDSYSTSRLHEHESEADEEGASTGSESSSSAASEPSEEPAPPPARCAPAARPSPPPDQPPPGAPAPAAPPARAPRDATRGARAGGRRERAARRRERAPSPVSRTPPRASPRPPPAVRWGASWSSVVSRGPPAPAPSPAPADAPPLAPIGSDVRRRLGSHSLFYYGSTGVPQSTWPPAGDAPTPPPPAPPLGGEYVEWGGEEPRGECVWSGAEPATWLWGGAAPVRPPPGFPPPRPVRPYDPFHSLASIWTPASLDWRMDSATPPLPDDVKQQDGTTPN